MNRDLLKGELNSCQYNHSIFIIYLFNYLFFSGGDAGEMIQNLIVCEIVV